MKRKILSLLTALTMMLVPIAAIAEDSAPSEETPVRTMTNPTGNMIVFDSSYGGAEQVRKISMLETDENGDIYAVTSNEIGLGKFNPTATDTSYDVNNINSIAWFLNNEASPWVIESKDDNADTITSELLGRTSANTYKTLIPGLWENIVEKDWSRITLDEDNKQVTETVRAKIGFLSVDEYNEYTYGGKIGYAGNNTANRTGYRFWLRDSVYAESADKIRAFAAYEHITGDPGTVICYAPDWSEGRIRPCFWLSRNVFTAMKLDISNTGSEVLAYIKANYKPAELAGLYTEYELYQIFGIATISEDPSEWKIVFDRGHSSNGAASTYNGVYKFNLMDVDENSTSSKFFVMSADELGGLARYNAAGHKFIDASADELSLGEFLNSDDLGDLGAAWKKATASTVANTNLTSSTYNTNTNYTTYKTLIPSLWNYIDENHVWTTEGVATQFTDGETFTAGVSVASLEELVMFNDRYGYHGSGASWTRSVYPGNSAVHMRVNNKGALVISNVTPSKADGRVRPCMWLSRDTFLNMKLDLESTGEEALKEIRSVYNRTELEATGFYTAQQLDTLYTDDSITVEKPVLTALEAKPGYTVYASAELPDGVTLRYQWMRDGAAIEGATESAYKLTNPDANTAVSVAVTPVKNGYIGAAAVSDALAIGDKLSGVSSIAEQSASNPEEYLFTVSVYTSGLGSDRRTYSLLDSTGKTADARFFVLSSREIGNGKFDSDTTAPYVYFNPDRETNIANYLKTVYYGGAEQASHALGSGSTLPKLHPSVKAYIDEDHQWLTKAPTANEDDYVVTAPIAVLSLQEYKQYIGKFGHGGNKNIKYFMRNAISGEQVYRVGINADTQEAAIYYTLPTGQEHYRPCFWLGEDFFLNVKCEVSSMGSEVKKAIIAEYTLEEMKAGKAGYTDAELTEIGYDIPVLGMEAAIDEFLGKNTITLTVTSNAQTGCKAVVIGAVYNEEGIMIAIGKKEVKALPAEETYTIHTNDYVGDGKLTAKAFVMESFASMKPYCTIEPYEFG